MQGRNDARGVGLVQLGMTSYFRRLGDAKIGRAGRRSLCQAGRIVIGLLGILGGASAIASPLPTSPAATFGVSMHGANARDIAAAAQAGAKFIRIDLPWENTEKAKGVYTWDAYEPLLKAMNAAGVRPILVLAYGNPVYSYRIPVERHGSYSMKPVAPEDRDTVSAYTNWASAAARRFAQYDPVYEIWNEPDITHFWPPRSDPSAYAQLVGAACSAIHSIAPQAPVVAGTGEAPGLHPTPFLQNFLTLRASGCPDAISVHPYLAWGSLNKYPAVWKALKGMMLAGPAANARLASTESSVSAMAGVTEAMQARYIALMLLQNIANGVALDIWYDWKDDGTDPGNEQHHFGLTYVNGAPKPALLAYSDLSRALRGTRFKCVTVLGGNSAYVFTTDQKYRVFTDGNTNSATGRIEQTGVSFVDMPGSSQLCSR